MMGSTVVDTSQLPLLVITLAGHVDDEPYHQFLANMSAVLDRQQRHATVVDATLAAVAPPGQRRLQAQWFKQEQHRLQKYWVGTAFAFSSPLVRGMLTAIFWLQPMPNAYTIVADVGLATAWARARLQATTWRLRLAAVPVSMGIDVNHSKLPLLVVTFKGTVSDDQFRQYLQETSAVLDMGRRYVTIMDATHAAVPTPTQRKMQADWMKKEAPRVGAHSLGAAFVIDSVLIRGALTAIFWLQPMAAPHIVVADLESAMTWARSRLPPPWQPRLRQTDELWAHAQQPRGCCSGNHCCQLSPPHALRWRRRCFKHGRWPTLDVGSKDGAMKTDFFSPLSVKRDWYVVDADGKTLGRLASQIANVLRGKNKPVFTPHDDVGDFVVVINCEKLQLKGKKEEQKIYWRYTRYYGGEKATPAHKMRAEHPERMMWFAVQGMLPKGPLGRQQLKKLKIYAGTNHPHTAQKPQPLDIKA